MSTLPERQEVHVWRAALLISADAEQAYRALLNDRERERADRFYAPLHRRRFTAARGILRTLLGQYLQLSPELVQFSYSPRHKPFLLDSDLQFNVSHSDEMAVFAFTRETPVGVDIEKMKPGFMMAVAKRYFSERELTDLQALPAPEQVTAFYGIWARKEAFVKALGVGLHFPFRELTVTVGQRVERLAYPFEGQKAWYLESLEVHPDYQAAVVVAGEEKTVLLQDFINR